MSKKLWQRVLSFITAVTMTATVMVGASWTAFATEPEQAEQKTDTTNVQTEQVATANEQAEETFEDKGKTELDTLGNPSNVINEIKILGFVEPTLGGSATTGTIKVPSDANYEITNVEWVDRIYGPGVTTFENGKTYFLQVVVVPKTGYELGGTIKYTIGDKVDYSSPYINSEIWIYSDYYHFYDDTSTIKRVDVNNVPAMKVGESTRTDITVPSDVKYSAKAQWYVWDESSQAYKKFTGTFEENKTYRLDIDVDADYGYRFTSTDTKVYFDGIETTVKDYDTNDLELEIHYPNKKDKVIDKVEVTVQKAETGGNGTVPPAVTLPQDANYKLLEATWCCKSGGNNLVGYEGDFLEGMIIGSYITMIPKEGYIFSDDLVFVVNGARVKLTADDLRPKRLAKSVYPNTPCIHHYDNDADATCNVCGEVREVSVQNNDAVIEDSSLKSPKTGDNYLTEIAIIVLVSMIMSATVIYMKKQRQ